MCFTEAVSFKHIIKVSYLSLVFNHNPSFCYSSHPEKSEEILSKIRNSVYNSRLLMLLLERNVHVPLMRVFHNNNKKPISNQTCKTPYLKGNEINL